ncbi:MULTISPECIES: hypothetical protein [Vibrio]|uniref:hypothetical protein n=1 Tax=Vibrio TaxID=662 RepID=UPI00215C447D|nr:MULTISPECIES: hypothetical protein [Vibrio]MCR9308627.1 hypothetical protein [Vibrio diabolicus]MDU9596013.1 hypothetical protein [Vibrio sp. 2-1-2a]MDU9605400.1 hypothetical protein [Vibrio sp. 1-2-3a]
MNIRDQFKLKVFQSEGTEYEKLFNDLMKLSTPGFRSVKPHGNIGDRGNDGWVQSEGKYYQVYAPEELFKNTDEAIKKVKSDFVKLKKYWDSISPIKSFYFVLNDKFKGVSPHITKILEEIKNENGLDDAGVFCNASMEELVLTLRQDAICSLLGVSHTETNPLYEDKKKVREFLDNLSFVTEELFESGREAGYFFPSNVFYFIQNWKNKDWQFQRLLSSNPITRNNQLNMREQLVLMHNQVSFDQNYDDIGVVFKFKPPYDLVGRDELIESNKDSMGEFIQKFANSYKIVRDYSV